MLIAIKQLVSITFYTTLKHHFRIDTIKNSKLSCVILH
jgi:hypothetical protein